MSTKNKSEEEVVNELGEEFLNYDGVESGNGGTEENTTTENVEKKTFEPVAEVKQPTDKNKDSEEEPLGKSGKVSTNLQEQAESGQTNGKAEQKEETEENEENKENNKEAEEEVFEVEAILDHKRQKNLTKYFIKWKGFSLEECTWENEDDVYAEELLEEYWAKQSQQADSSKSQNKRKGGRKRAAQSPPPPTPAKRETKKQRSQTKTKTTNKTRTEQQEEEEASQQASTTSSSTESWEDKVIAVETVTRDDKTGDLLVYLKWNNGETSRHPAKDVNIKCPQKMIKFYEQRLTFAPPSTHNKS